MNTNGVKLKTPQWEDMLCIRRLWADPETMASVGGPVLLTDQKAKAWFKKMIDPGNPADCYRLIMNDQEQPVGEVSWHRLNPETMTAEFNLKVLCSQRGKGYGTKAMHLILNDFFGSFGGQVMLDGLALDNQNGQQTLLKFGFEHDASVNDVFMLYMTRQRYHKLYSK